jgi:hypothetical protein
MEPVLPGAAAYGVCGAAVAPRNRPAAVVFVPYRLPPCR